MNAIEKYEGPASVFESLRTDLFKRIDEDSEVAEMFERLRTFRLAFNTSDDASRLAELDKMGADKLGIRVGRLPREVGPGLAYMYDIALEGIRANPERIKSATLSTRRLRAAAGLFEAGALKIGSLTVTAMEQALADPDFADRLRGRANEIVYFDNPPPPDGLCEFCQIDYTDSRTIPTTFESFCATEDECKGIGGFLLLLVILLLVLGLIELLW